MTIWSILWSVIAVVVAYIFVAIQQNTPKNDFQALQVPGPVLLGGADGVKLDGLTLIRTVRMPVIKIVLPGIGTLRIKNSTSELVFSKLRVADVRLRAPDVGKEIVTAGALVDADMTGTCLTHVEFQLHLGWLGLKPKILRTSTSGRLATSIKGLNASLPLQVGVNTANKPALKSHGIIFSGGQIEKLSFSAAPLAKYAAGIPLWLSVSPLINFLLSDLTRSKELKEGLDQVWSRAAPYVDLSAWAGIHLERQLPPPSPSTFPAKLEASFSLLGQSNFTDIELPDHAPKLYKEGSKRAYIQSWNKLTSEVKLEIKGNKIRRLGFNKASLEWNAPTSQHVLDPETITDPANTHIMVCRIENFYAEVTSNFAMFADMGKVLQLVTNQRQVGEKGQSKAQVRSSRFELVFKVVIDEAGVSVTTLNVDDFDHIEVNVSGLWAKTNDLVNSALKLVKPQIATVAGSLLKGFLAEKVKESTNAFEKVEEALLMRGVEIPGVFRARPVQQAAEEKAAAIAGEDATTTTDPHIQ